MLRLIVIYDTDCPFSRLRFSRVRVNALRSVKRTTQLNKSYRHKQYRNIKIVTLLHQIGSYEERKDSGTHDPRISMNCYSSDHAIVVIFFQYNHVIFESFLRLQKEPICLDKKKRSSRTHQKVVHIQ